MIDELSPAVSTLGFTDEELQEIIDAGFPLEDLPTICEPDYIGPTWMKDAFGRWVLPKRTLGWQIAAWCAEYLLNINDPELPWEFTLEQLRFVLWWYAVDETGDFVYRTGVLQRMKGWGKDPLLAALCLAELVGPCRFGGWDEDGDPIGVPHNRAYVQVTAVSQDQTENTMDLIPSLISERMRVEYGVKAGAVLIRANLGRSKLVAVTSSFRALEGKRTTFTLLNETHHWVKGNDGHKMYETIDGNATKVEGRYLAITNAFLPGEDSVGERMRTTWEHIAEGRIDKSDFLYDSIEAHPKVPLYGPLLDHVIRKVRGDAVWLNPTAIKSSIADPEMPASRSRRMWLNQVIAEEESLHGPDTWDPLKDPKLAALAEKGGPLAGLKKGERIVLGFDGGKSDDATALVAIRVGDGAIFLLGLWEKAEVARSKADEDWTVDREDVDSAVHEAFANYKVVAFHADVAHWESYIDAWAQKYGDRLEVKALNNHAIAWDMRSSLKLSTMAHERLMSAIFDRKLKHNGDRRLRRHAMNTRRRVNNYGLSFGKESRHSQRKIDAYAALMLAHEALTNHRLKAKPEKPKTRRGYFL